MDFLSNYGASPKFSLDIASRAIGLPGKFGISGVDVGQYHQDGRHEEIRDYCETDVIATSAMMLRVMHLTGELSTKGFRKSANAFLDFLNKSSQEKPHIQEFLKLLDLERFTGVISSLEENAGMSVIPSNSNVTKFPGGLQ
jgi:predicted PolB exonuclease-like 3'-5' exonuclease